jgi:hypothetical protein
MANPALAIALLAVAGVCSGTKATLDRPNELTRFRTRRRTQGQDPEPIATAQAIDQNHETGDSQPDRPHRSGFSMILLIALLVAGAAFLIVRTLKTRRPVEDLDVGSLLESEDLY